ncbi:ATP-dependent zinc protease family protein [Mariniblastus fucicola]|uniref:Retropepsin-like aspartic endopeptidase domain-containing protein n=1 Tax=Mariniblastus fucicola TaxID=980251 RepID=A0A5B9P4G1_9BACT|nr:RimK/LysX family protein [Mariniblastus fucicola]QEG20399.1 hypothetical protein MFFC18_02470 [Mariniblastus fucicola]
MAKKIRNIKDLPVIGWREFIALPDLGVKRIKVKVDTGARSSSLHAYRIEEFSKGDEQWVRFKVCPDQHSNKKVVSAEAKILDSRLVKNSGGKQNRRYVIETTLRLLDEDFPIELTLANRSEMGFRMLLGRQATRRRFLVDSGGSYYNGHQKPKKKKKLTPKS